MTGRRECVCPKARHVHGTRGAYQKDGCRCFPCRIASSDADARADYRDVGVFVPRVGTIRRLEALHAVGWSESDIARRLGVSKQAVQGWRTHRSDRILATTAASVAGVYDRLWDKPATGRMRARTLNWAARNRWFPPLAWDDDTIDDPAANADVLMLARFAWLSTERTRDIVDEIAVERALAGEQLPLTKAEQTVIRLALEARGTSAADIAAATGLASRTVTRSRARERKAA